jgi:hypothetical protein
METSNSKLSAEVADLLELGSVLGHNQAFGLVAGRCSAAQAASLKRLRDEKKYKLVTDHWRDFCSWYLRMSQTQADKIIHLWEEFGAGFFKVAQLTRISPETYRAIAPAVREDVLHLNGEVIELTAANSRQVVEAVARVRREKQPARQINEHQRLEELDERLMSIIDVLLNLSFEERAGEDWLLFTDMLSRACCALRSLLVENGVFIGG